MIQNIRILISSTVCGVKLNETEVKAGIQIMIPLFKIKFDMASLSSLYFAACKPN